LLPLEHEELPAVTRVEEESRDGLRAFAVGIPEGAINVKSGSKSETLIHLRRRVELLARNQVINVDLQKVKAGSPRPD
jgi:hypothetical protein